LPKTTPRSRPSSDDPGWKVRITTIGDGARPAANLSDSLPAIKGSRTPTDAGLPACLAASAHPAGRARLSAFHGGSALGTHASQGAASDQVSRRWRLDGGGLPPAPTPVTASTSHAGHSAGGHDVRYRPSATGTNPLRAGTASRSRQPESPSGVLARGARGPRFYSYRAPSQAESLWDSIYLNSLVFRIGSAMRCRAFRPESNKKSANLC
jgi:hypothetical protein